MATGNTCGATDSSLPRDLLEELRKYLAADPKRTKHYQKRMGEPRKFLDDIDCCLLEDLGGIYCGSARCCHDARGKKTSAHTPGKEIGEPLPEEAPARPRPGKPADRNTVRARARAPRGKR